MYRSTGIIEKHEQLIKWKQFRNKNFQSNADSNPVEIKNIAPIIQILILFYIAAIIILLFEYFCKRLQKLLAITIKFILRIK